MAGPVTLLTGLLLLALCTHHFTPTGSVVIPTSCCMSFHSKKIPEARVISYQLSSGSICPRAGVIFVTKRGQRICCNPKEQWVQKYMKKLDAKRKKACQGQDPPAQPRYLVFYDC
ncbi:LOW QUALITY PROTEIN: C-C motif chemokine 24 [Rhynchocyon petersi]